MPTKETVQLRNIADNKQFSLTKNGVTYTLQTVERGLAIFTSNNSGRTYRKPLSTQVYKK